MSSGHSLRLVSAGRQAVTPRRLTWSHPLMLVILRSLAPRSHFAVAGGGDAVRELAGMLWGGRRLRVGLWLSFSVGWHSCGSVGVAVALPGVAGVEVTGGWALLAECHYKEHVN